MHIYDHICTKDHTFWCLPLLHFRLHQVVKNRLSPWDIQCDMMIMMTSNPIHVLGRLGSRWRHVAFAHWLVWELSSASPMVCICCWLLLLTFYFLIFSKCSTLAIRRWSQITCWHLLNSLILLIFGYESKPWYLVNPKIAGKWMFIPLKMVSIGIDPYPYLYLFYFQGGCFRSHQAWAPKARKLLGRCKPGRAQQLRASSGCSEPGWAFRNRSKGTASRDYVWIWLKIRILYILVGIFRYCPTAGALFPAFEIWDIEIFTVWKNHFLKEADPRCRRRKRSKVPAQARQLGEKQQRQSYGRCSSRLNLILGSVSKPCTPGEHQNSW